MTYNSFGKESCAYLPNELAGEFVADNRMGIYIIHYNNVYQSQSVISRCVCEVVTHERL